MIPHLRRRLQERRKATQLRQAAVAHPVDSIINLIQNDWPALTVHNFRRATFDDFVTEKPPAVASQT